MQPLAGQGAASATLLDNIFRNAPMVHYIAEAEEGSAITYVSPNIEKMLGHPPEKFLALSSFWRAHIHPEDADHVLDKLDRISNTGHQIIEYRFLDTQGDYRWLRDEVILVHPEDGSPDYLQGYWHDISDQKNREAALLGAQLALQGKVHDMQSLLDGLPQRLLWKDRNSVFRGCNLAAAHTVGLERPDEIIGKTDFDLQADRMEAEYLRLSDEAVMATGQAICHADIPAKQEGVWLDVTKVPLHNGSGAVSGLLISYEDVSEEMRNKFTLCSFKRAVELSSSVVIITDLKGNIEYVNPRFQQLYGYSENEVLGKNPSLLKSDTANAKAHQELWQTLLKGETWHGVFQNRAKNGEQYWQSASISPIHDENGAFAHFLAIEDDITQRKLLEASLQQQLAFTQTLINALPHMVYYKNRDGIYQGCNRAFEEFMGLSAGEIVGKTVFDVAPPEIAQKYLTMDNELFAHPGIQSYETQMRHHDGSLHDILSYKATFTDARGEVGGIIGSAFDIGDRKRIEEALRQSEERFRTIANHTYNWENWIDPKGKLLWVNPAVERITGYTPEACYAMPDFPVQIIHPDDWPAVAEHYAESLAGAGHRDLEFRILRKDGGVHWAEVAVQQVYDANGQNIGHRSSVRDVTDRKQAMDALDDTRSMLQLVLDHIPQGVFWKSLAGTYLGANTIFARNIGLSRGDEVKGLTDYDIFPSGEAKKFRRDDRKVLRTDKSRTSIEEQFTDSQGIKHWVLTSKVPLHNHKGEVFGLLGTYADLTELRQMDADLRESEARLREITSTAAEGIYVMDAEGALTFVNPEAEKLLGWNASELMGQICHPIFHVSRQNNPGSPDVDIGDCCIMAVTRTGKQFSSDEEVFFRKGGTPFNVSVRATPITRNGQNVGAVVAFHDITKQKLTQRHLSETLQELQAINSSLAQRVEEQTQQNVEKERLLIQQSRSAAMGEMISNIAHQWRQPLSTLGLIVQNILLDYRENQLIQEELEKYVDTALQCVTLMSETIDDFRNFFLPDKAKVFFNLKQAIDESLRLLEATLKNNNIKVLLDGDAGMHTFGHANEFSQVILNLLANAKDALMINKVPHGRIEIELRSADNIGIVMIRDNAGGIPEETLEKIFDPYFTTKIGGTGIGLYMSKTIIEKHMGGSIVCRNTPDGAEFTVSIPLGENHNAEPE